MAQDIRLPQEEPQAFTEGMPPHVAQALLDLYDGGDTALVRFHSIDRGYTWFLLGPNRIEIRLEEIQNYNLGRDHLRPLAWVPIDLDLLLALCDRADAPATYRGGVELLQQDQEASEAPEEER